MSEGGFLLVTRERKNSDAPRAHFFGASPRHCASRGDGPSFFCKYFALIFDNHLRAKQAIERARAINFVE